MVTKSSVNPVPLILSYTTECAPGIFRALLVLGRCVSVIACQIYSVLA